MEKEIILKPKYELKDFLRFTFSNISKSIGFRLVVLIAMFLLVFDLLYFLDILDIFEKKLPLFNIIFPLLVFVIFPLSLFFITKTSFNKNFRLKEDITLTINSVYLREKGETFDVKTPWNEIESIIEHKHLFIINHDKYKKGFISKKHFSKTDLIEFKEILENIIFKK